jgi:hypothetical protein
MNEDLQFDRAETPSQEAATCRQCQAPLRDHYFAVNGAMLCDTCVETVRQVASGVGTPVGRFSRATLLGAGAMLISAVAYSLWMGFTNTEFALITIAMGWFVGKAVRRGSGDRGGWRYGLLAVVLTYCAIAFSSRQADPDRRAGHRSGFGHRRFTRHRPIRRGRSEPAQSSSRTLHVVVARGRFCHAGD